MSKKRSGKKVEKNETQMSVAADSGVDKYCDFDDMSENNFDSSENEVPEEEEVIELPYPVQLTTEVRLGKQNYTELVFRNELTVGMIKHLPASSDTSMYKIGHFLPIIAAMTGVPTAVVERLNMDDFKACANVVSNFL